MSNPRESAETRAIQDASVAPALVWMGRLLAVGILVTLICAPRPMPAAVVNIRGLAGQRPAQLDAIFGKPVRVRNPKPGDTGNDAHTQTRTYALDGSDGIVFSIEQGQRPHANLTIPKGLPVHISVYLPSPESTPERALAEVGASPRGVVLSDTADARQWDDGHGWQLAAYINTRRHWGRVDLEYKAAD